MGMSDARSLAGCLSSALSVRVVGAALRQGFGRLLLDDVDRVLAHDLGQCRGRDRGAGQKGRALAIGFKQQAVGPSKGVGKWVAGAHGRAAPVGQRGADVAGATGAAGTAGAGTGCTRGSTRFGSAAFGSSRGWRTEGGTISLLSLRGSICGAPFTLPITVLGSGRPV